MADIGEHFETFEGTIQNATDNENELDYFLLTALDKNILEGSFECKEQYYDITPLDKSELQELDMLICENETEKLSNCEVVSCQEDSDPEDLSDGDSEYVPNSGTSTDSSDGCNDTMLFIPKLKTFPKTNKKRIELRKMALVDDFDSEDIPDIECCDTTNEKTVTSTKDPKAKKRRARPARPCLYCSKLMCKLTRHLKAKHKNEEKVAHALCLPKHEQVKEFELIRKEGIFKYNMNNVKEEKPLLCERGQAENGVKVCSFCKAFIRRKYFFNHSKHCRQRYGGEFIRGFPIQLANESDSMEFIDLLSRFNDDEVGKLCKSDTALRLIGRANFNKHKRKRDKVTEARKAVMAKMRTLANLYKEFVRCSKDDSLGVENMFVRKHFVALEEAVQNLSSHRDGTLKPGLKISIGNILKQSAKVLKGHYLILDDDISADSVDKFLAVLALRWTSIFGDAEYQLLKSRNENLRQPVRLPDESNVKKIRDYTVLQLNSLLKDPFRLVCSEFFITIRNLAVSRLTLFNARRGGEPSRLQMRDWEDAKNGKWIDEQRIGKVDRKEKSMLNTLKVIYQGGKGTNHLVPVLVPPDCDAALEFLSNSGNRVKSEVNPRNHFLFPSTMMSMDHASGWHAVKYIADAANVSSHITATSMRHRASTLYAQLDVPEDQRKAFFSHMGHSADMNKDVYQCPLGIQEITKVGGYFAALDGLNIEDNGNRADVREDGNGVDSTHSGDQHTPLIVEVLSPSQLDTMLAPDATLRGESSLLVDEHDDSLVSHVESDTTEDFTPPKKKKTGTDSNRQYVKWSITATKKLCEYFKRFIEDITEKGNKGGLPGYEDIKEFLFTTGVLEDIKDTKTKIKLTHTKIFNERKKYRERYNKRLLSLTQ